MPEIKNFTHYMHQAVKDERSGYAAVGNEQLHYLQWGSGKRLLLAFHGYGDSAVMFNLLPEYLTREYTIFSFDLPYHGGSVWTDNKQLKRRFLGEMVVKLMTDFNVDKVALIGYSIGGRVCLGIFDTLPSRIERIVLMAADGMRVDPYYYFFTGTGIGKKLFRNMLEKPKPYFRLMAWVKKMKLVHESRYKFALHFLHSEHSRHLLQQVWPAMSGLMPSPKRLKALIKKHKLPVTIFMGAYDRIMPPAIAMKFKKDLNTVQLHVVNKGHRILDHETAQQVAESLL